MKKYILFTFLVLFGCSQVPSMGVLPISRERNEICMDMKPLLPPKVVMEV